MLVRLATIGKFATPRAALCGCLAISGANETMYRELFKRAETGVSADTGLSSALTLLQSSLDSIRYKEP